LLVHGGRDQKRSWDWVARELASDYRVIAHDLRGHGASEHVSDGEYSVMDHVFDLASLVAHLKAVYGDRADQFTLIGHSLGGNIAVRYAGIYPEKIMQLVAIEGLGASPKMQEERRAEKLETRLQNWVAQRAKLSGRTARTMANYEEAAARMRAAHGHLSEEQIAHLTQHGIKDNADGTVSWCYDPAGMGRSPSDITQAEFEALWARITCPTWLVYGANSWASNPEKDGRAVHFQNATVTEISAASHWVHHDQFTAFMTGLNQFLGRV
jgi:pimeloyl-ACP methyl ester carboxylesterase